MKDLPYKYDNVHLFDWLIVVFHFPSGKFYNKFIDNITEYEAYCESEKFKKQSSKLFQKTFVTYYKLD